MAAVIERSRTGKGAYVEASLLDTAMSLISYMAQSYWRTGKNLRRMDTTHPSLSPYQAFETCDGYLMLGVGREGRAVEALLLCCRP